MEQHNAVIYILCQAFHSEKESTDPDRLYDGPLYRLGIEVSLTERIIIPCGFVFSIHMSHFVEEFLSDCQFYIGAS